ncbi:MAG: chemotaxis protein CheW [Actinobacteria bacterium]|nr:chemotaxis protein CheW [Actinomycetota bacterium]
MDRQVVVFQLNNESYAVDIGGVKEIVRLPQITRIPHAPAYYGGRAGPARPGHGCGRPPQEFRPRRQRRHERQPRHRALAGPDAGWSDRRWRVRDARHPGRRGRCHPRHRVDGFGRLHHRRGALRGQARHPAGLREAALQR